MKRIAVSMLMIGLAVVLVVGCGDPASESDDSSAKRGDGKTGEAYSPSIDPADFTTRVDNKYFPLKPGTTLVYEGQTKDGTERTEFTVTEPLGYGVEYT